jgi:hypothetical protein
MQGRFPCQDDEGQGAYAELAWMGRKKTDLPPGAINCAGPGLNHDGTNGPAVVGNGASVEVTGPYSGSVTFAGSTGTLQIDHAADFSGTVAGLAGTQDMLDFLDIDPAKVHTPTLNNATSSGGTLNVTDSTHTANIALIGNYLASTFVPTSDGHGGTAVHDPVTGTAEPLVTPPHG